MLLIYLLRFFEREVNFGVKLLQTVRQDLEDVVAITSSGKKQTNHHRSLIATLTKGMIPTSWLRYKVPTSCSVAAWVKGWGGRGCETPGGLCSDEIQCKSVTRF